jgi:hypothetical protein
MPKSECMLAMGKASCRYQKHTATTVDNVDVVRDMARVHDGVKTTDTTTTAARETPESIGAAGKRQSADCQRQRGGLVVHHNEGDCCF